MEGSIPTRVAGLLRCAESTGLPRGARRNHRPCAARLSEFQSTRPRWARRQPDAVALAFVSIHAPAWARLGLGCSVVSPVGCFHSTRPRWGACRPSFGDACDLLLYRPVGLPGIGNGKRAKDLAIHLDV